MVNGSFISQYQYNLNNSMKCARTYYHDNSYIYTITLMLTYHMCTFLMWKGNQLVAVRYISGGLKCYFDVISIL